MGYECDACGAEFDTLSQKRLHECDRVSIARGHDIETGVPPAETVFPETVIDLPRGYLSMEQAAALDDDPALTRFFPILALGEPGELYDWSVVIGYADTGDTHVLIGFDCERGDWVVIEENAGDAVFTHDEDELARWIVDRNNVDPVDVVGYESSSPDYPDFQ